jgi:molybdopterin-guanine dinucleotide biosynthesis protein B
LEKTFGNEYKKTAETQRTRSFPKDLARNFVYLLDIPWLPGNLMMNETPPAMNRRLPLSKAVAIVGPSNSGKTELICRLVAWFQARGLAVAVLKHSHHPNLGDTGKDTGRYRRAGAGNVALAGPGLLQITISLPSDPGAEEVLSSWAPDADLILVEGYKSSSLPKIALVGPNLEKVLTDFSQVIALVGETPGSSRLPVFTSEQVEELGRFIRAFLSQGN